MAQENIAYQAKRIIDVDQAFDPSAEWGVAILEDNHLVFEHNYERPFAAADINNLAIAQALDHTNTDLNREMVLQETDYRQNRGILQHFPLGYRLTLGAAVRLSLSIGDSTATRMMVRAGGGPSRINTVLADLPLAVTRLTEYLPRDNSPEAKFEYGSTNAVESLWLLHHNLGTPTGAHALYHGSFFNGLRRDLEPVKPQLTRTQLAEKLASWMPGKAPAALYDKLVSLSLPLPSTVANKEGAGWDSQHDVAKIGRYTVAALSTSNIVESERTHHSRLSQAKLGVLLQQAA